MSLFEGVVSQYIDDNGKTRMLNYGDGISLMTSPLPPLNIEVDNTINKVTLEKAKKFIKERNLKISMQDGDSEIRQIQGLWVKDEKSNPEIYFGYIPIEVSDALPDVIFVPEILNDPLRTDKSSDLQKMRKNRKIADYLEQYTLFEYAQDPENFDEETAFVVDKDHKYDIEILGKKLIKDNNIIYYNGRIIVPSEEIKEKLIGRLKVYLLNDSPGVLKYKDYTVLQNYYKSLSDFRAIPNQLVFLNRLSLIRWKQERIHNKNNSKVFDQPNEDMWEPYFYRNTYILNNRMCIIQNVEDGMLEKALLVGMRWMKDKINIGYTAENKGVLIDESEIRSLVYTVYTEEGKGRTIKPSKSSKKERVYIFEYESGIFASLLPL